MTQLRLIGTAALTALGASAPHLLERKDAALLAMLALDGPTARPRLAALLWPEVSAQAARGNLRQRLFRLRGAVGRDVVQAGATLRLLDDVAIDIAQLRDHLLADPQAGQGELLAGHDYSDHDELDHWVEQARERWRATRLSLLAQVASDHESRREIAAALAYAQRMLIDEPLLEHAHRRVMRLHYLRGDRAAAMAAYETCREELGQQLGMRPSAETVDLARLIESSGALPQPAPAPRPIATLRPPRLVGRQAEWELAGRVLAQGGCVLLTGEAGIGKTRFLSERVAASAGDDAVTASARPGDARLPYALAGRLVHALAQRFGAPGAAWAREELARIAPLLGSAPAGVLAVPRLQQALAEALAAWGSAGLALLAIDDVHFADEASLELLPTLVVRRGDHGVPCLLALRGAETPPLLAEWLAAQDDGVSLQRIALGALDAPAVRALLESLAIPGFDSAAWSAPLARHTGGNPLYILETLIALLDADAKALQAAPKDLPSPANIGALIERRLSQLSPGALRLARLAAVAGVDFSVSLAAQVFEQHALDIADAWSELEQALVIRDDAFAHDLIREAALRSVPAAIARQMHTDVARVLERTAGEHARLAQHWAAAHQWPAAGACFMRAAAGALALSQRRLEVDLLLQAADCFVRCGDQAAEFCARELLAYASRYVATYAAQTARTADLERLARDDTQRAAALEAQATVLSDDQQDDAALVAAREAGRLARALGDATRELSVARLEARALSRMNRQREALDLLRTRLPQAWAHERDGLGARVLIDLATTLINCDRSSEALPVLQRALELASRLQDLGLSHEAVVNLAWSRCCQGQLVESTRDYEYARALLEQAGGDGAAVAIHDVALPRQYKELGRFSEALARIEATLQAMRRSANLALTSAAECELANIWLWLGQPARAVQTLGSPRPNASPSIKAGLLLTRARIASWQGQPAQELLREALEVVAGEGRDYYRLTLEGELARLLPPHEALPLLQAGLACSEAIALHVATWPLKSAACDALRRAGRADEAADLARQIMARFAVGPPFIRYPPEYWLIAHQALMAAGDIDGARHALDRAVGWISEVALPNVPVEFQDGFLHRQPINLAVAVARARSD